MRFTEVKNFYKNSSKERILAIVESRNNTNVNSKVLADIIYAANNPKVWKEVTPEALLKEIRERTNGKRLG